MKTIWIVLTVLLVLGMLISACGPETAPSLDTAVQGQKPMSEQSVTAIVLQEINGWMQLDFGGDIGIRWTQDTSGVEDLLYVGADPRSDITSYQLWKGDTFDNLTRSSEYAVSKSALIAVLQQQLTTTPGVPTEQPGAMSPATPTMQVTPEATEQANQKKQIHVIADGATLSQAKISALAVGFVVTVALAPKEGEPEGYEVTNQAITTHSLIDLTNRSAHMYILYLQEETSSDIAQKYVFLIHQQALRKNAQVIVLMVSDGPQYKTDHIIISNKKYGESLEKLVRAFFIP